jgi:hypothetical protein
VARGDRIAIVLPNGPEIILCVFAIALLGAVAGPLNEMFSPPRLITTRSRFQIPRTPTGKVQRSRMASHLRLSDG